MRLRASLTRTPAGPSYSDRPTCDQRSSAVVLRREKNNNADNKKPSGRESGVRADGGATAAAV